jgi:hypothetical protein
MKAFAALVAREVRLAWTGGGLWLPVIFYLAVATLFPFVTGPDKALLARTGGGILWIAALLATLLPIERYTPDRQAGILDRWRCAVGRTNCRDRQNHARFLPLPFLLLRRSSVPRSSDRLRRNWGRCCLALPWHCPASGIGHHRSADGGS